MDQRQKLTHKQKQVLDFIQKYSKETGSTPTLKEICSHFDFKSSNSARQHLRLIAQKGGLELLPGRARGIRLPQHSTTPQPVSLVPLVGRIAAGDPIGAIEYAEAVLPLPNDLWPEDELFALRVHGDSMIGAGIFDGDIAVVTAQPVAENGSIAAVVIADDITLKRYFRSASGIRLRAENSRYSDLVIDPQDSDNIRVAGVLVGTLRTF